MDSCCVSNEQQAAAAASIPTTTSTSAATTVCCSNTHAQSPEDSSASSPHASVSSASLCGMASHGTVTIHTGNVRRCNSLRAIVKPDTRDEVATALRCALTCWRKFVGELPVFTREIIGHPTLMQQMSSQEKETSEILVKVFLCNDASGSRVRDAVDAVFYAIAPHRIDSLVVALSHAQDAASLPPGFDNVWKAMEAEVKGGRAKAIGVTDFSISNLQAMASPPNINMVDLNSADFAVTSPLLAYAREHGVKLLSHSDGPDTDILPSSLFSSMMNDAVCGGGLCGEKERKETQWRPLWVARYTVVDKPRSLISNLGYVVCGEYSCAS